MFVLKAYTYLGIFATDIGIGLDVTSSSYYKFLTLKNLS